MGKKASIGALFLQFLKFGCFTFGGGWSIVSQMQKTYVEKDGVITNEELLDLTSVGRSLPGTMIGNVAMLFGYRQAGMLGGVVCVLGMILPPMAILTCITMFYVAFRNSYWVSAAMTGIGAAIVPIILSAAVPLMKSALKAPVGIVIALATLAAYLLGVGCVWLVVVGAICGLVLKAFWFKGGDKA